VSAMRRRPTAFLAALAALAVAAPAAQAATPSKSAAWDDVTWTAPTAKSGKGAATGSLAHAKAPWRGHKK